MKETITSKIIEGGKAREINHLGAMPIKKIQLFGHPNPHHYSFNKWIEAESKLRTFEIESEIKNPESPCSIAYALNSIHQAKLLENGKIEII